MTEVGGAGEYSGGRCRARRRQEDHRGEQHVDGRGRAAHQAELHEQEADHRGGEHLEEALDPQVHHPPAPVFDHRRCACARPTSGRRRRTGRSRPWTGTAGRRSSSCRPARIAGHRARPIRVSHRIRPTNRKTCQKRPMSTYSQPWWPNQKFFARPSFCITANHWPAKAPTTMISRQTNRKLTPARWNFGSMTRDRRRDEQPGAQPGGGDPQHAELGVPAARQRIGQHSASLNP
jgi:hypothetical protein